MSFGRERQRLPVEPAFEQQRPAGVARALEALLELGLQTVELLGRQLAVRRGIDERAGRPRGVVEQRLVPARRGVVGVDGGGRGLDRAHAVVVVDGMEEAHVQDRADAGHGLGSEAHERPSAVYS